MAEPAEVLDKLDPDEWSCAECAEIYTGPKRHEGIDGEPICCRCFGALTGDACQEHPLFPV